MKTNSRRHLLGVAALSAALSTPAAMAAPFTLNPAALGDPTPAFTTDDVSGPMSLLLTNHSPATASGVGWIQFSTFSRNGNHFGGLQGLYATFELTEAYRAGTGLPGEQRVNGMGTTNDLTSFKFRFYADVNHDTTFMTANAQQGSAAEVSGGHGDDVLLAVGDLVNGTIGFQLTQWNQEVRHSFAVCTGAGTATTGGAPSNSALAAECASGAGAGFFASPDPFLSAAAARFGTLNGISTFANRVSIFDGGGRMELVPRVSAVPEPGSAALVAAGAGVLWLARRRGARRA